MALRGPFKGYLDGSNNNWVPNSGSGDTFTPTEISPTGQLTLGARDYGGGVDEQYEGQLDEVRVWSTARTAEQIDDNFQKELTGSETGLTALWQFEADDIVNGTVKDITDNGHTAIMGSSIPGDDAEPLFIIPPVHALSFDGTDDYVDTGVTTLGEDFTFEAWVYSGDNPVDGNFKPIASKHTSDGANNSAAEFNLQINDFGKLNFFMGDGINVATPEISLDSAALTAEQWYKVSVTVDGDDGSGQTVASMYVNGELVSTGSTSAAHRQTGSQALQIGRYDNQDASVQFFDSLVGNVTLWDDVRTATEIADGLGPIQTDEPNLVGNWRFEDTSGSNVAKDTSGFGNDGTINGATYVDVAPQLVQSTITLNEDTPLFGQLVADDPDTNAVAVWDLATGPSNGTVKVNSDGTFGYKPYENYAGADTFSVNVTDNNGATTTQTVSITVTAKDDAPVLLGASGPQTVLQFDGGDQILTVADAANLDPNSGSFTVEFWADIRDTSTLHYLAAKGNQFAANEGWSITIDGSDRLVVRAADGTDTAAQ